MAHGKNTRSIPASDTAKVRDVLLKHEKKVHEK